MAHVLALSFVFAATKDVTWHLPLWAMTSLVWWLLPGCEQTFDMA
jgi:hypothetical protein